MFLALFVLVLAAALLFAGNEVRCACTGQCLERVCV